MGEKLSPSLVRESGIYSAMDENNKLVPFSAARPSLLERMRVGQQMNVTKM